MRAKPGQRLPRFLDGQIAVMRRTARIVGGLINGATAVGRPLAQEMQRLIQVFDIVAGGFGF